MNSYLGEMERCTTFKEKARKQPDNVNAGLLTYPTLMAADILIHKAIKVPVGKDQEQNMEMARKFARRFNTMYETELFPEPQSFSLASQAVKIPGLDGSGKMGKSEGEGNAIYLADEPEAIRKKVMKAVTDSGPTMPNQEKPEVIKNIFQLMHVVSAPETFNYFDEMYNTCQIRYGDMKKQLAEDMILFTAPFREKIKEISADEAYVSRAARIGKEKAQESASKTVSEIREIIGFKKF
jgi:tryptophanyl-tRNA synthetase